MRAPKFYKIVFLTSVSHFIPLSQPYFSVCIYFPRIDLVVPSQAYNVVERISGEM